MSKNRQIVFIDKSIGLEGDFPVAVIYDQEFHNIDGAKVANMVVDPILDHNVTRNLYGRMMTLVEATTDSNKLQAVKDLFGKELKSWENDVYGSARELAEKGDSSTNIYTRRTIQ